MSSDDQDGEEVENVNIQRVHELENEINPDVITSEFGDVYSPDDFPGVVWVYNSDVTAVIYNTGTVIGHGPSETVIDDAVGNIKAQIADLD